MDDDVVHPSSFSHDWWCVTLSSIGDAVIATDPSGRIAFLNPVAEALTGWTQSDAFGRPLDEVFVIVNETTRTRVQDPVAKVLRSGHVVGLANHTVLINRVGRDIPIDDSAAPIRNNEGELSGVVLIFRDITERRRTELSQSYLAAIVESSFDAIIGKNLDGVITSWNQAAERIFGYKKQEAIGQPITLIIPPERHAEEVDILARLRRGERTEHFETVRVRKDGTRINISLTVSPIRHSTGTIIGASKIARDITERKHAERERERLLKSEQAARNKAEEANRLKDEFLATVSHELRTPLTSILGWSTLLRTPRMSQDQTQQGLETIQRNAKTQAQVIEDLLDVSRIITGKLRLEIRPIMAGPVVESAIASVRPMAEAKGVGLHAQIAENAGFVTADTGRLQQVIWNLLNNAIKFTPRGGQVRVLVNRADSQIEIIVSDTGQGIRPEFLPHVFDRFRQAESSTTRKHGGLGLGLAIVRHLVELHGGTVTASSAGQGQGATFSVRFPLLPDRREEADSLAALEEPATNVATAGVLADLEDVKALIVDDDADTRQLLRVTIEQAGAKVRDAATAEEGLREAKQWKPSIILADIGMPGKDGYEFIKELREWERHSGARTPAVALTAYARAEDQLHALNAGYEVHISKPIEPDKLLTLIASQLGRTKPGGDVSQ
jgi:PAS domain S-box-containing protein